MTEIHAPDIFLSHASEDKPFAREVVDHLGQHGWLVFLDEQIKSGENWRDELDDRLGLARCVVVLWSKVSVGKPWVREEAQAALDRNIYRPVCIDQVEPPRGFREFQAIPAYGRNQTAVETIFQVVRDCLGPPPNEAPSVEEPEDAVARVLARTIDRSDQIAEINKALPDKDRCVALIECDEALADHIWTGRVEDWPRWVRDGHRPAQGMSWEPYERDVFERYFQRQIAGGHSATPAAAVLQWVNEGVPFKVVHVAVDQGDVERRMLDAIGGACEFLETVPAFATGHYLLVLIAVLRAPSTHFVARIHRHLAIGRLRRALVKLDGTVLPPLEQIRKSHVNIWTRSFLAELREHYDAEQLQQALDPVFLEQDEWSYWRLRPRLYDAFKSLQGGSA